MQEILESILEEFTQKFADTRTNYFKVQPEGEKSDRVLLTGKVLNQSDKHQLLSALAERAPELQADASKVIVLRKSNPRLCSVATNLATLQAEPRWLSEMVSQMVYGSRVEILDEQENWVFIRQADGYLGWTYRPYLTDGLPVEATHIVTAGVSLARVDPESSAPLVTRFVGGTEVHLLATQRNWSQVQGNAIGWVPSEDLRDLANLVQNPEEIRHRMVTDAARLIGVPYLWGGTTAHGIDCSGFAQLLHRWNGITIPRDADMQYAAGRKIEPPFLPGSLIFFSETGAGGRITHVAVSVGGWKIIHSSRSRNGVYYDDLDCLESLRARVVGAATYLES